METTTWLWPGWIPRGHLSLICGPPDVNKSLLASWLATTVLRGGALPDGTRTHIDPDSGVMWLDSKAGYERLQERFGGQDFPRSRLFWPLDPDKPEERFPTVDLCDGRWRELVAAIAAQERPAWLIINGLGDHHADILLGDRIFAAMATVAHDVGCAVTFILDRAGRLPCPGETRRWALPTQRLRTIVSVSSWAPDSTDLRLRVARTDGSRPEPVRVRIVEGNPTVVHRAARPSKSAIDRAVEYVKQCLGSGPKPAAQLIAAAKWQNGISRRSLERAKRRIGVRCYRKQDRWWWTLS